MLIIIQYSPSLVDVVTGRGMNRTRFLRGASTSLFLSQKDYSD